MGRGDGIESKVGFEAFRVEFDKQVESYLAQNVVSIRKKASSRIEKIFLKSFEKVVERILVKRIRDVLEKSLERYLDTLLKRLQAADWETMGDRHVQAYLAKIAHVIELKVPYVVSKQSTYAGDGSLLDELIIKNINAFQARLKEQGQ